MPCSSRWACSSLHLLLRDLDLLETRGDLLEGQEATFLALGDERAELLQLDDRRLVGQQHLSLLGRQSLRPPTSSSSSARASGAPSSAISSLLTVVRFATSSRWG